MDIINQHIEDLLRNHNCVIIPDFGGFITNKKEAFYDKKKQIFFPAKLNVLFNKNLITNDGLLASRIADKQSISFENATNQLIEFKNNCISKLKLNGRHEIERVGILFFDKENNIQFKQSQENYLKDSYGLSPKLLTKTNPMIKKENFIKEKTTTTVVERKTETQRVDRVTMANSLPNQNLLTEPRKRKVFKAVPLLLIPMLLITAFFGNQKGIIGDSPINMASLNPFSSSSTQAYSPRNGKTFLVDENGESLSVSSENNENYIIESEDLSSETNETENNITEEDITPESTPEIIQETTTEITPEVVSEPIIEEAPLEEIAPEPVVEKEVPVKKESTFVSKSNTSLKYHAIVGCFGVKQNADNFVSTWINKGTEASIIDKKGKLYRVAVQSFATRKEAKSFLKTLKSEHQTSAWVLRK